jgi:predicted transcriptional regulator of viral defense system
VIEWREGSGGWEEGSEKRGEDLSENRQDILDAIRENPQVTHAQLIKIVGIAHTNIAKNISYLKEKGYIRRIGPARGGYWEILSSVSEVDMGAILEVWESSVRATHGFLNRKKLFTKSISAYILEAIFIKRYVKWPVARQ